MNDTSSDECNNIDTGSYNTTLHIAAVFIEIAVSFLGTMIPIIGKKNPRFQISDFVFSLGKNFGTGVILATAFIHMLAPAYENLTNDCLPDFFSGDYPFAPLFALLAVLSIQFIQTLATAHARGTLSTSTVNATGYDYHTIESESSGAYGGHEHHDHVHTLLLEKDKSARRISTYMLELGIATHSVIIGITLGVARDDEFKGLLIALAFHQFFEGIALSTTVLDAGFKSLVQPVGVVIFYTLTTPVGVAIGIVISSTYNANSTSALLVEGIFDAVSAGILLYDGLVNMVNNNITHSEEFLNASPIRKFFSFVALWLGVTIMAIIGKWA